MKILAVSDIHQSMAPHHGKDESDNFSRFLMVIEQEKPDLVLICGDTENITEYSIEELDKANTLIILGNHDISNIITDSGMFLDCVAEHGGVTIAGISGIVTRHKPDNNLKFSKEDIMLKASKIKQRLKELNAPLDILITHEMPKINSGFADNFYNTRSSAVFGDALYMLKPKLAISGHLHGNKTLITKYEHGTLINLGAFTDGHYAIINVKDSRFEIDNIISVKILTL